MSENPRKLFTCLSPALIDLYDLSNSVVVIIDVLRATSTIATALYNGAASVIPVASVPRCIEIGEEVGGITAGERDGKVADGLPMAILLLNIQRNSLKIKYWYSPLPMVPSFCTWHWTGGRLRSSLVLSLIFLPYVIIS